VQWPDPVDVLALVRNAHHELVQTAEFGVTTKEVLAYLLVISCPSESQGLPNR
jgi:hypothetical protein